MNLNYKLILIGICLLSFVYVVQAATLSGGFSGEVYQEQTLTKTFELCNDSSYTKTLQIKTLEEECDPFCISLAQEKTSLNADECTNVFMFLTPLRFTAAKDYPITLIVNDAETLSKTFDLTVLQGHKLKLTVNPAEQTAGQCEQKEFKIKVENTGRFNEDITLSVSGIASSWVSMEKQFFLEKGSSKEITLKVLAPCNAEVKQYDFTLKASIDKSDFSVEKTLTYSLQNEQLIEVDFPQTINACRDEKSSQTIEVTNTGRMADEISIKLLEPSFALISTKNLSLNTNELKEITVNFNTTEKEEGNYDLALEIKSAKFNTYYSKKTTVNLMDCYNVQLEKVSGSEQACVEDKLVYKFKLSNNKSKTVDLTLSGKGLNASFNKNRFMLAPGQSEEFEVAFNLTEKDIGMKTFEVSIQSDNFNSKTSFELELLDCSNIGILTEKTVFEAQAGECLTIPVTLKNNGTLNQTVTVSVKAPEWVFIEPTEITLEPKESKQVFVYVTPPLDFKEERLNIELIVSGLKDFTASKQLSFNVFGAETTTIGVKDVSVKDISVGEIIELTEKQVIVVFKLTNTSDKLLKISNITARDLNSTFKLEKETLEANESQTVQMEIFTDTTFNSKEFSIPIRIETNRGTIDTKLQLMPAAEESEQPVEGTALLLVGNTMNAAILIIAVIVILVILYAAIKMGGKKEAEFPTFSSEPETSSFTATDEIKKAVTRKPRKVKRTRKIKRKRR